MKSTLSTVIGWLLIAAAVFYVLLNPSIPQNLSGLSPLYIFTLVFLSIGILLINGVFFRLLTATAGISLAVTEWIGLPASNTMYNLVLPAKGGIFAKGYYLKQRYSMPMSVFLAQTAGGSWVLIGSATLLLPLALLTLHILRPNSLPVGLFYGSLTLLTLWATISAAFLALATTSVRLRKLPAFLRPTVLGINALKRHQGSFLLLAVSAVLLVLLSAARLYISCRALGYPANLVGAVAVQSVVTLSFVVSLTPGNLGIKEGVTAASAGLLGITLEQAMLAALVDRAVATLVIVAAGSVYGRLLAKRLPRPSVP